MHRIKWPRLTRLVRQAQMCSNSKDARRAAADLAAELYRNDLEPWAHKLLDQDLIKLLPTASTAYRGLIPLSYDFVSFLVHGSYIDYLVSRSMICGLVLALSDISPPVAEVDRFNISAVMAEDVRTANHIVMCTEYSMTAYTAIPLVALRQIMPLKVSGQPGTVMKTEPGDVQNVLRPYKVNG